MKEVGGTPILQKNNTLPLMPSLFQYSEMTSLGVSFLVGQSSIFYTKVIQVLSYSNSGCEID